MRPQQPSLVRRRWPNPAGFGVAGAALVVDPQLGAYLVAAGLLGHAAWDVDHHRANRVVVRSLAEFCLVLDTPLAVAMVALQIPWLP